MAQPEPQAGGAQERDVVAPGASASPSGEVATRRLRLTYLDSVRALAAIYVVLHHIWLTVWPQFPHNAGPPWLGWLAYGQLGVAVFIVLSGFSLALEPLRNGHRLVGGAQRFFRRRAWRILPPYWAALVISVLVIVLFTSAYGEVTNAKAFIVHGLLLQDIIGSPSPNGAFWSIAIEWQIYFFFPLLLWYRRRSGVPSLIATTTIVVIASYLLSIWVPALAPIQRLLPQFLALFVFGMAAAEVTAATASRWANGVPWFRIGCLGSAALITYAALVGSVPVVLHYFWIDLAVGVCVAMMLAGLADSRPRRVRDFLNTVGLRTVGRFSYSIYLMHVPILALIWLYVVQPLHWASVPSFFLLLGIALPVVIVVSYGFSAVFEQPFVRNRSWSDFQRSLRRLKLQRAA